MQRVLIPAGSIQTVCVALGAALLTAACGSAGGELDASSRPAATSSPTPSRTANGQPIIAPAASGSAPAATPAAVTPLPATATEALSPADVVFDAPDAGPNPVPATRPSPSVPPSATDPSPPPANGGNDEEEEDDDDEDD